MPDQRASAAAAVPAGMAGDVAGYRWTKSDVGEAGCAVHRLHGRVDALDLYLKHGRGALAGDLADEHVRLRWLAQHIPVPAVRHFVSTTDEAWLLTVAVPGQTARQLLRDDPATGPAIVDELAGFLRRLHAIAPAECPFMGDHVHRLALGRARIDAGLVDEDDFDDERLGWSAEEVWIALQRSLPLATDRVVTHGDCTLDNILLLDGVIAGCIDVGRAGLADRHQDVAILWNDLGEFGPALQDRLLAQYGQAEIDRDRLRFHLLLDELF
jgi:aminoglycoside 3'-phosphotransferase I